MRVDELSGGDRDSANLVIYGENLEVMRILLQDYSREVRCVYIDPPYNNNEKYNHYRDDFGHAAWLKNIRARLSLLWEFLRDDGSIWISIDDSEMHYLKVAADEIFGRDHFVTTIVWQQRTTRENRRVFSNNHEYILVYAKNIAEFKRTRNRLPLTESVRQRYKNPDGDPRGRWQSVSANVQAGHGTDSQFYAITGPTGKLFWPPKGRCWVYSKERMEREIACNNIWFGKSGNGVPRIKRFLDDGQDCLTPETLWLAGDAGTNLGAKKHLNALIPDHPVFDTPKPEELIRQILLIASDPGDLVLDAYLGSGTTAAVAHKMQRKYIGIEAGDHAVSHAAQRLQKVISGEQGGVSKVSHWNGGGGFQFLRLSTGGTSPR